MFQPKIVWPTGPYFWRTEHYSLCSIPFTWNIKSVRESIQTHPGLWKVGGPACDLTPDAFADMPEVCTSHGFPGVLQRINPYATRTTLGCPRRCLYCGIGQRRIEPVFKELEDWPDLPVICDNNLLAASETHLEKVFARLRWWGWADFNQGLDCRKITPEIAAGIHSIGKPMVRVALDGWQVVDQWEKAVRLLRSAGIAKRRLHSYVMIGYGDAPGWDIKRIQFAKDILGASSVNAMWFHELDATKANTVTAIQHKYGWSEELRIQTMRWSYGRGPKPDNRFKATEKGANT